MNKDVLQLHANETLVPLSSQSGQVVRRQGTASDSREAVQSGKGRDSSWVAVDDWHRWIGRRNRSGYNLQRLRLASGLARRASSIHHTDYTALDSAAVSDRLPGRDSARYKAKQTDINPQRWINWAAAAILVLLQP